MDITSFFDDVGGVAGTPQIAWLFRVSQTTVRDWAYENDVPRVGNSFAFTEETARSFANDVLGEDDNGDGDEDEVDDDRDVDELDDDENDGDQDDDDEHIDTDNYEDD